MNTNVMNIIIGGIAALAILFSTLALIGWFKNKGRRSLPLTYKGKWYHDLIKIPTTIFYTWGENCLKINWLDWEIGVGKISNFPKNSNMRGLPKNLQKDYSLKLPTMGDYILVLGKWNHVIVLVITDFNPLNNQIETCALGYLNARS
jgi:hypothetical protein